MKKIVVTLLAFLGIASIAVTAAIFAPEWT